MPSRPQLLGLHHVTATVDDAQADLDFAAGALAMRLVKKTVNFDNHSVYHFYYGNERGLPGTIWTTFPYKGKGVNPGVRGAGQIVTTSFSVPAGSLVRWQARLAERRIRAHPAQPRFGEDVLRFWDSSGLAFELVATDADDRTAWLGRGVSAADAIRGIHSVTLLVRELEPTLKFMRDVLGFSVVHETPARVRMATGGALAGHLVDVTPDASVASGVNGVGVVHHVAFAIATGEEQTALRADLAAIGLRVTPVMDRSYFQSIYFREPGGVLFEVATVSPGFLVDEGLADLGTGLKLPKWEESNRRTIETVLPRVTRARGA